MLDSLLFSAARVWTFIDEQMLTSASGFFFEVGPRLFLITSRHVLTDEDSGHYPDRIVRPGLLFPPPRLFEVVMESIDDSGSCNWQSSRCASAKFAIQ